MQGLCTLLVALLAYFTQMLLPFFATCFILAGALAVPMTPSEVTVIPDPGLNRGVLVNWASDPSVL